MGKYKFKKKDYYICMLDYCRFFKMALLYQKVINQTMAIRDLFTWKCDLYYPDKKSVSLLKELTYGKETSPCWLNGRNILDK